MNIEPGIKTTHATNTTQLGSGCRETKLTPEPVASAWSPKATVKAIVEAFPPPCTNVNHGNFLMAGVLCTCSPDYVSAAEIETLEAELNSTAIKNWFRSLRGSYEGTTTQKLAAMIKKYPSEWTEVQEEWADVIEEPERNQYTVTVSCTFDDMRSPEDAVAAMAGWLDGEAYCAGYRVKNEDTGLSLFIDAEKIDFNAIYLEDN